MAIYLEFPRLDKAFPYRCIENDGNILTTPHWHKEMEIIWIVKGKVNLGVNDQPMQLKENEFVFIKGGDIHYVMASPKSERLVFQFDLSFFQDVMILNNTPFTLKELFASIEPYSTYWRPEVQKKILQLLNELYQEGKTQQIGYAYAIKSLLCELITVMYRELDHFKPRMVSNKPYSREILEQLSMVFQYVEKNYTHPIKLEDAAKILGFTPSYFTKFFKKHTGKTFVTFLNEYRIDKAKWILLNEDDPVTEIAGKVGFGSTKTFYRLFKESIGTAPLQYKSSTIKGAFGQDQI
jgi:AraC-like DNA-binding protein